MGTGISIRPSKDIRTNYAQISELTRQNPVALTLNGKEDTVLISHEDFIAQQNLIADLQAKLEVYIHLAQSADDIKLGRVKPAGVVFDELKKELNNLDI